MILFFAVISEHWIYWYKITVTLKSGYSKTQSDSGKVRRSFPRVKSIAYHRILLVASQCDQDQSVWKATVSFNYRVSNLLFWWYMVHRYDMNIDLQVLMVPPRPLGLSSTITPKFVHIGKSVAINISISNQFQAFRILVIVWSANNCQLMYHWFLITFIFL